MIDYQYLAGRLTREPELRWTKNGTAVATLTLAQSSAHKDDTGNWQTTAERFVDVTIFDEPDDRTHPTAWARLAASHLTKGTAVIVHGRLVTHTWQTQDGQNRSRLEFRADRIATELTHLPQAAVRPAQQQSSGWAVQDAKGGFGGGAGEEQPPF